MSAVPGRTRSLRHIATGLLGVVVATALLAWCFRRAGLADVRTALGALTIFALLPALACEVAVQLAKALKWAAVLRGTARVRYASALVAVVVGAASTHLVPLRLDEVLRAAVLGRRERIDPARVLGTIAIDRAIEVLVAGLLLGAVALASDLHGWMRTGARVLWIGFLLGVAAAVLFVRAEDRLRPRMEASTLPFVPRLAALLRSLAEGLRVLPRGRAVVLVVAGALLEWLAVIAFYWWVLHVFSVDGGRAFPLVLALGNAVAYAVPNVPGALGTYEAVQSSLLAGPGVGLPPAEAMAIALAAHAVLIVPVTLAGTILGLVEWRRSPESAGAPAGAGSP